MQNNKAARNNHLWNHRQIQFCPMHSSRSHSLPVSSPIQLNVNNIIQNELTEKNWLMNYIDQFRCTIAVEYLLYSSFSHYRHRKKFSSSNSFCIIIHIQKATDGGD